jgi:general secretion pathway protein E
MPAMSDVAAIDSDLLTPAAEDLAAATAAEPLPSPRKLPFGFAKRHQVLLANAEPPQLLCVTLPSLETLAEVQRYLARGICIQLVSLEEFQRTLTKTYERDSNEAMQMVEDLGGDMDLTSLANALPETEDLLEQEDDAPIIRLINALLSEAIKLNASDIHIETFENRLLVRFRIDGILREVVQPRRELAPLLVSRIKVMSKLDIAEKRVPQDGRISLRIGGREVDIRVYDCWTNKPVA